MKTSEFCKHFYRTIRHCGHEASPSMVDDLVKRFGDETGAEGIKDIATQFDTVMRDNIYRVIALATTRELAPFIGLEDDLPAVASAWISENLV